jgi:hypothetical protein
LEFHFEDITNSQIGPHTPLDVFAAQHPVHVVR